MEEWRAIPGYKGYEASSLGQVRSIDRWVEHLDRRCAQPKRRMLKGKVLSPGKIKSGYLTVHLGFHKPTKKVQYLVALAFIGERPTGLQVCHNDGNKLNNRLDNLRYDTNSSNQMDRITHGTSNRGERHGMSKKNREKRACL